MDDGSADYQAYLLRIWRVRGAPGLPWRASLQPIPAGLAQGFADLHKLFAFLEAQTGVQRPDNTATDDESAAEQ